jgi:hypothetical protein
VPKIETQDLDEKIVFEWEAYERPHKKWSKEFYSTVIVLAFLVSVILFFIEGYMPVLVVWSMVFMLWAMGKTDPRKEKYAITTWGLKLPERTYRLTEMSNFWIESKWGSRLLRINLSGAPWHLVVVINEEDESQIKNLILAGVIYQTPQVTWSDRMGKWLGEKMPLE